jgi:hypothetical protein
MRAVIADLVRYLLGMIWFSVPTPDQVRGKLFRIMPFEQPRR